MNLILEDVSPDLPIKQFGDYIEFCDSLIKIDMIASVCLVDESASDDLPDELHPKTVRISLTNGIVVTSRSFYNGSITATHQIFDIATSIIKGRQNRVY